MDEEHMKHLLKINVWSHLEQKFRRHLREFQQNKENISLQVQFENKLKASYYGLFLKECNFDGDKQNEDNLLHKLGILKWDLKHKEYMYNNEYTDIIENRKHSPEEHHEIEFKCFNELVMKEVPMITQFDNNFTDDPLKVLEEIILSTHCVDIPTIYKKLKFLRVVHAKITDMNNCVSKFQDLEILSLAGNYLKLILWEKLPKKIKILQLFANFITSLSPINNRIPKGFVFLGLGRNCLNDRSGLHLLSNYMKHLHILDISNNEIACLECVLSSLYELQHLRHLSLEGNPCAVVTGYKDAVLSYIHKLKSLDCVMLHSKDFIVNPLYEPSIHNYEAFLIFNCYRVIGLPKPPIQKGKANEETTQSRFYIEIEVPLLDPDKRNSKATSIAHKSRHKKYKLATLYERENEVKSEEFKPNEIRKNEFVSCKKVYSTKIEFPIPTIIIPAPQNNLAALRNSFRSAITVKLIYCVLGEPHVIKSEKSRISMKKKNYSVKKYENIIQKFTLVKFKCHLRQLNWTEKIIDYSWDIKQTSEKSEGIVVVEGLQYLRFVESPNSSAVNKKSTGQLKTPEVSITPSVLTIHVGFGLSRLEMKTKSLNQKF